MSHTRHRLIQTYAVMFAIGLLVCAVCLPVVGQTTDSAKEDTRPDFASFDKEVLVILAENQYGEIQRLKREVAELRDTLATDHGVRVDGGVASIPEGSWVVKIRSVSMADTSSLDRELKRLRGGGQAVAEQPGGSYGTPDEYGGGLDPYAARAATRRSHTGTPTKGRNQTRGRPTSDRGDASANTQRIREKRGRAVRISALQRKIDAATDTVIVQAVTQKGLAITITARGVHADEGWGLIEGRTYTITGSGAFSDTEGKIDLKSSVIHPE